MKKPHPISPHFEHYFTGGGEHIGPVLFYHLNLEALLKLILEKSLKHPEVIDMKRTMFAQKASLCRALGLLDKNTYKLLLSLNSLRNKFAHQFGYSVSFEEVYGLAEQAGRAGVEFTDSVDSAGLSGAKTLGYDVESLLNEIFRNTFFEIAFDQEEKLGINLVS